MKLLRRNPQLVATLVVFLVAFITASCCYKGFGSLRVFVNLLTGNSFLGITAIGMTFVIISGGIDLSIGAVIAFTATLISVLVGPAHGWHPLVAASLGLTVGTLYGALMGFIIEAFALPAFLVTLAGMFLARGMSFVLSKESVAVAHPFYRMLGDWNISLGPKVSLPFTAIVMLVAFIVALVVANFTRFGRDVYAIGGKEQSARLMGLPVARTRVQVYALNGLCSALAGVMVTLYMSSGNPAFGVGLELDAIAVVVIGGTLLTGGVGGLGGTFVALLIYGTLQSALNFDGRLNSSWLRIFMGVLLLSFILLQRVLVGKTDEK